MFGLFRKKRKPANSIEAIVKALYGANPPKKTADVQLAVMLAADELLCGAFDKPAVTRIAEELNGGPIPYSTHDLAASVALNLFKSVLPENRYEMFEIQVAARLTVQSWVKEGKINPLLAQSFEHVLYEGYRPSPPRSGSDDTQEPVTRESVEHGLDELAALDELAEILAHGATTFPSDEVIAKYMAESGYDEIPTIRLRFGLSIANQVLTIWLINEHLDDTPLRNVLIDKVRDAFYARQPQTNVCIGDVIVEPEEIDQVRKYIEEATNNSYPDVQSVETTLWSLLDVIYVLRQQTYVQALQIASLMASNSQLKNEYSLLTFMARKLSMHVTGETSRSKSESFVRFASGLEAFLNNYVVRTRALVPTVR